MVRVAASPCQKPLRIRLPPWTTPRSPTRPANSTRSTSSYGGFFDIPGKSAALKDLNDKVEADPNFWNDPQKSAPILKEKKVLELALQRADRLKATKDDLTAALELAAEGDDDYLAEANTLYAAMKTELQALEVQSLLGGEVDVNDAIVTINAGAGGTESQDWASMLFRMYLRYAERKGWSVEMFDELAGEEAGIKSATFQCSGPFAFGLLKAESGVHRLVRISPYDSNARRHTSFASVFVTPVIDDTIVIEINPADLEVGTFRASGAGGQHVNKTESAVRIKHVPSGIVVASQTQRSQHQNRDNAMKMLRSALYEREMEERRKKQGQVEATKSDISFGSQIRSYVLHPYQLVKDHRTEHETSQTGATLDGDIEAFINAYLVMTREPS
jgi:peptide chain release factor 2